MLFSSSQKIDDDESLEDIFNFNESWFLTLVMSIEPRLNDSDITIEEKLMISK